MRQSLNINFRYLLYHIQALCSYNNNINNRNDNSSFDAKHFVITSLLDIMYFLFLCSNVMKLFLMRKTAYIVD